VNTTHLCLVSEQPLPNLVPVLDPAMHCSRVFLLTTPPMAERARWLADVMTRQGKEVQQIPVHTENLSAFREHVSQLLEQNPNAILNATGGLKTMTLAAFDAARAADRAVYYVERNNRLTWLHPMDRPGEPLPGVLDLSTYLAAFGQTIRQAEDQPLKHDGGLERLGRIHTLPPPGPSEIGSLFESIVFRAMREATRQRPTRGLFGVVRGLKTDGSSEDEFDVAAIQNNTLYLVECKHTGSASNLNGYLNKLENLRQRRGLTARAALITTANVPERGGYATRARNADILLLGRTELPNLVERFKTWLSR
jgi:hypothetical protein